ncbi:MULTISPECIES: hypothetical protein [Shewanella]|uniref:Uncharacterized protein n=1 Tax=Shewanella sedimentimangrovi TaxID=2814293 RepID=A0ABX7R729_9GAMM|nr:MULTISPECIES: hypothetical protein [Shewanella]QSX38893.1 hypothetical protein JYB85_08905 [Shewanella sedimentimangrovi]QSX42447.1 hypothetical protein JYB84_08715 [Shewanella cyperi]
MPVLQRIPTDLEVLNTIYRMYHSDFIAFDEDARTRESKVYVPIDFMRVANELKVDIDIVFGRLYFHLNKLYSYEQDNAPKVQLFILSAGKDLRCINFPLMTSVLANLRQERDKFLIGTWIAFSAFFISAVSLAVSIMK